MQIRTVATLAPRRLLGEDLARREVRWAPDGPGPFPDFHGELLAKAANGERSFRLDETFDAIVGRSVAQSTARELLARIKSAIQDAAEPTKRPRGGSGSARIT